MENTKITIFSLKRFAFRCLLAPRALSQDFVEVQSDGLLVDQALNLALQGVGQDPHQSLGSEPVLGPLFVVSLRHISEHVVTGQVNIVDDLAQVGLEVGVGQVLQIVQVGLGNFTLPLQFAFAFFADGTEFLVGVHVGGEGLLDLEALGGSGDLATGESEVLLVVIGDAGDGSQTLFPQVGGEADHVEVLGDVVHNFGFEEGLGGIVHDLVAELGLGDVFTQLLNASALGRGSVFVNDLIAFPLGSRQVQVRFQDFDEDLA